MKPTPLHDLDDETLHAMIANMTALDKLDLVARLYFHSSTSRECAVALLQAHYDDIGPAPTALTLN
jgi:hypothetical protein